MSELEPSTIAVSTVRNSRVQVPRPLLESTSLHPDSAAQWVLARAFTASTPGMDARVHVLLNSSFEVCLPRDFHTKRAKIDADGYVHPVPHYLTNEHDVIWFTGNTFEDVPVPAAAVLKNGTSSTREEVIDWWRGFGEHYIQWCRK